MLDFLTRLFRRKPITTVSRADTWDEGDAGGEPYELNDNDRGDEYLSTHWRDKGDMWAHQDTSRRQDAEEKAHQETNNSGFLTGAAKQYAQELIGPRGPNFEIIRDQEPDLTEDQAREYETLFLEWLGYIQFARKMRTICRTEMPRGEGLGHFHAITGRDSLATWEHPINITFTAVDSRRLGAYGSNSLLYDARSNGVDLKDSEGFINGIKYDKFQRPIEYKIAKMNPAALHGRSIDGLIPQGSPRFDRRPVELVVHWFQWDHAEQKRGFSQIASTLVPSVLVRRGAYSITKVLKNMAQFFGWIETPDISEATTEEIADGNGGTCVRPIKRIKGTKKKTVRWRDNALKVLGGGQKAHINEVRQPGAGTWEHYTSMLGWVGRAILSPLFQLTGDYSKANFTSTRAGLQPWDCHIATQQADLEAEAFDKALRVWQDAALALQDTGYMSRGLVDALNRRSSWPATPRHRWLYGCRPAISPLIERRANQVGLQTGELGFADLVRTGNFVTKWKTEAKQLEITYAQYVRIKLASTHGLTPEQLQVLLDEDERVNQESGNGDQEEESNATEQAPVASG